MPQYQQAEQPCPSPIAEAPDPVHFSIIIPEWPDGREPFSLDYLGKLDWPSENMEVLVCRGYSPCDQRNLAARRARGNILVFLDNDSCPRPDYLRRLASHFDDPAVVAAGGPAGHLPNADFVPTLVGRVLDSRVAVLSKAARYKPSGSLRPGRDSDLIFCNFAIRRGLYISLHGLDKRLCPNEDNEFLERLWRTVPAQGVLYDPKLLVRRPIDNSFWFFVRKMFGYGKGRARQFKIRPSLWSLMHLLAGTMLFVPLLLAWQVGLWTMLLFAVPYGVALCMQILCCMRACGRLSVALMIAPATVATHLAYAAGLWKGFFLEGKAPKRPAFEIQLERFEPEPDGGWRVSQLTS